MARGRESGYALLLVFLMAAILAIGLYSEIPRVAFESQRQKEQLLMARGTQYMRGIQVYQQTLKGWPQKIEDLETFQSRHFIRHKYIDPMTGKAEWRVIHMQNGVLIDSAVTKAPDNTQQGAQNYFITPTAGVGGVDPNAQTGFRSQMRRRDSESPGGSSSGQLAPIPGPVGDGGPAPGAGTQANPGQQPGQPQPGQPGIGQTNPANQPNQQNPMGPPVAGTQGVAASQPTGSLFGPQGGAAPQPTGGLFGPAPGVPPLAGPPLAGPPSGGPPLGGPSPQPGQPPLPGTDQARSMINQLLTQPRPAPGAVGMPGGGTGIAGVASKAKAEGIMLYNDHTAYNEWEFLFDPTKVPPVGAGGGVSMNSSKAPGAPQTSQTPMMGTRLGQTTGQSGITGMQQQQGSAQGMFGFGSGTSGQSGGRGQPGAPGMQNTGAAAGTGFPTGYRPGRP